MSKVYTCPIFRALPGWQYHKTSFEDYKLKGIVPDYFGRDAELSLPDVHHIHLAHTDELAAEWVERYPHISQVYYRTTRISEPENDYWLIYAYDDVDQCYLLLTIVGPEAHNQDKWRSYLNGLLISIVEPWIQGRLEGVE
ncbi:type II toxin-antitoxin system YafO family toxin [Marinobacterium sp. AK62]|uniref:Type II toxin-antitoxin system YafO family toxin n=1 Tax=Marinobacterium alkalitolerans TaxID=1542925 RepID=A0ABS3ZDR9_9GAMM|nr:type II toxin-antitoxin system YafO family toxin [Marinobacterium alkalitolerans]MBP0049850.1 type II toxin-antitoxin system YafO family toxin [Marinobacterium alkalitolerans]